MGTDAAGWRPVNSFLSQKFSSLLTHALTISNLSIEERVLRPVAEHRFDLLLPAIVPPFVVKDGHNTPSLLASSGRHHSRFGIGLIGWWGTHPAQKTHCDGQ